MADNIASLRDLYVQELKDLLSAEDQIIEALPRFIEKASDAELRQLFEQHRSTSQVQRRRLETILAELGETANGVTCEAVAGLVRECQRLLDATGPGSIIDAGLISAGNRLEHYEIAGYGAVREYAEVLGFDDHAALLQETLDEEGAADKRLTSLSEEINLDAYANS